MKVQKLILPLAIAGLMSACATPQRDIAGLKGQMDQVTAGDFGQFLHHSWQAEENFEVAVKILDHWENDHYWNIDMNHRANEAAGSALEHRKQAEAAFERWHVPIIKRIEYLEALHQIDAPKQGVAYFDTGSAVPQQINQQQLTEVIDIIKKYPGAHVDVVAYTDTVGNSHSNKHLAMARANAIRKVLLDNGVASDARVEEHPIGEASGPDNTPNQENRRVDIFVHPHGHHGMPHGNCCK